MRTLLRTLSLVCVVAIYILSTSIVDGFIANGDIIGFWEVIMACYIGIFTTSSVLFSNAARHVRRRRR